MGRKGRFMIEYRLGLYEKALPNELALEEKLELAHASGFDWLELSVDESEAKLGRLYQSPAETGAMVQAIHHSGLPIRTLCLSGHRKYPLGSRDPAIRAKSLDILERAIALGCALGVRLIQLAGYDVYYEAGGEDTQAYFLESLSQAVHMAACAGMDLGFETMETLFMDTVAKAMAYVQAIGSPYLGLYPDIGNLTNAAVLYGHDQIQDLHMGKGHIFAAHLKETQPGVYRNMEFGTGHTPYIPCIQELHSQGVAMFTGEFWYQGEPDYQRRLSAASHFLRQKIETPWMAGATD